MCTLRKAGIYLIIGLLLLAMVGAMGCTSEPSSTPAPSKVVSTPAPTKTVSTPAPTKTVSTPAPTLKPSSATLGERNAAAKAEQYLSIMAFSRSGLIKQLEYEGYSHQEAVYGTDQTGADWNEQAALKAEQYLELMAFSRSGLIEQLEYEGFTPQQAEYGVRAVGY